MIQPQELAQIYDEQIKQVIFEKYAVPSMELLVLSEDKNGAYFSTEKADTWCCFVVGKNNGFLYLVTAKVEHEGRELRDFHSTIVS